MWVQSPILALVAHFRCIHLWQHVVPHVRNRLLRWHDNWSTYPQTITMDVTHYLSLKPIPRWSPIPPNSVAYLQGFYYSDDLARGTMFVLYKNKQELVIVGPPLRKDKEVENMKEDDRRILLTNLFSEYLTIIVRHPRMLMLMSVEVIPLGGSYSYHWVWDHRPCTPRSRSFHWRLSDHTRLRKATTSSLMSDMGAHNSNRRSWSHCLGSVRGPTRLVERQRSWWVHYFLLNDGSRWASYA